VKCVTTSATNSNGVQRTCHTRDLSSSLKHLETIDGSRNTRTRGKGPATTSLKHTSRFQLKAPCPPSANRRASPEQCTPQLHQVLGVVQRLNSAHHALEVCPDRVDPLEPPTCQGHQRRVAVDAHGGGLRDEPGPAEGCESALIQVISGRPTVRKERGQNLTLGRRDCMDGKTTQIKENTYFVCRASKPSPTSMVKDPTKNLTKDSENILQNLASEALRNPCLL
jgi:hypothetical protein